MQQLNYALKNASDPLEIMDRRDIAFIEVKTSHDLRRWIHFPYKIYSPFRFHRSIGMQ
jgi:hypothetical protein